MTEKEIRQKAEERYLFPTVEYDDYNSVNAFVEGAKFMAEEIAKWLDEHLAKDTSILATGPTHIGFGGLITNFRKEFLEE